MLFTFDKKRLSRHFLKDPALFAYHLGDLDDFQFDFCQWAVMFGRRLCIEEAILIYTGLKTPTILAFGLTDEFEELLRELLQIAPLEFHGHYQVRHRHLFGQAGYTETPYGTACKMQFKQDTIIPVSVSDGRLTRLNETHVTELLLLYERAYPDNYFDRRMLETGKYLGCILDGRIVAVTGVHVDSDEYKTCCLGNIVTDPEFRGRGLATALTSQLVSELVDEGKTVSLNVMASNAAAIHCYEKLGFEKVHEYEEAFFVRTGCS